MYIHTYVYSQMVYVHLLSRDRADVYMHSTLDVYICTAL